jgi:hypothetical protein
MKKQTSKQASKAEVKKEVEQPEEEKKEEPVVKTSGSGEFVYPDGTTYIGEWKLVEGVKVRDGKGKLIHAFKDPHVKVAEEYEGEWSNDKMNGYGVYKYASGAVYSGQWKNNKHHGKGEYKMTSGCKYEGEWCEHKFSGTGVYKDMEGINWEGEFVDGVYESKDQKRLQAERAILTYIEETKKDIRNVFSLFVDTFSQSDKKSYKEHLSPFFGNAEAVGEFFAEPYVKPEEKTYDKWASIMTMLKDAPELYINVLKEAGGATMIEADRVKGKQLSKDGGQVVEVEMKTPEEQFVKMVLCQAKNNRWTICFYQDNLTAKIGRASCRERVWS